MPALLVILADRISKWLVTQHMTIGESISLMGSNLVRLTYVQNPGIAFGIRLIPPGFLAIFSAVTSLVLIAYLYHLRNNRTFIKIPLSLILGGALGNLIDRILYGQVIDFIDVDFPDFITTRWPVFNVADSSVTVGMVILAFFLVFLSNRDAATSASPPAV